MTPNDAQTRRRARDLRLVAAALALLAVCGALWLWQSGDARGKREAVLARVPDFPAPGQQATHPHRADSTGPRLPPPIPREKPVRPPQPAQRKLDRITSFALHPAHSVSVVHLNALLNTPLFEKLRSCFPDRFDDVEKATQTIGLDLQRDVDQVSVVDGGFAVSGFFEGKPVAQTIAQRWQATDQQVDAQTYRGASVFKNRYRAVAQVGNLLLEGPADGIEGLVDRALDPPPESADPEQIYGDVYLRSDLSGLNQNSSSSNDTQSPSRDAMTAVLGVMSGMTMRANVWDSVALSVEGAPKDGQSARDLAQMARGALSLVREQLGQDDAELSALAELARVDSNKDQLRVDLAVPAADLFDKLHFPCPGHQAPPRPLPGPNVPRSN